MDNEATRAVAAVRHFNRFYTRRIGVLHEGLLASEFSLAEVRVLYELAHRRDCVAGELAALLALDTGYLSRILAGFEKRGFVTRSRAKDDARRRTLVLTAKGKAAFAPLERRSQAEVAAMLRPLAPATRARLTGAMQTIEALLEPPPDASSPLVLRAPRPGDMGWVIQAHGDLYWREYGWDERFEALVAGIVVAWMGKHDPRHEQAWIAERDGVNVGSVFLVRQSATVAKLRLLLVDPAARGSGLGRHLVEQCIRFARECGYRRITLWTQENLVAARHIYQRAGFELKAREPHAIFGVPLVGETWELDLKRP
jgi:DNA-binding MarR family transcriptional regulator/GNAT superfamily N-acetyltransferase